MCARFSCFLVGLGVVSARDFDEYASAKGRLRATVPRFWGANNAVKDAYKSGNSILR